MSNPFPLPEARLVSVFLESIFYGAYLITVGFTIRYFVRKEDYWTALIHYVLAFATALLAAVVTLDVSIAFRQVFIAFIVSSSPQDGLNYLKDPTNRDNILRAVCTPILALIADGMLIYRCAIIFEKRLVVIIAPVLLWIANLTLCVIAISIATLSKSKDFFNVSSSKPFIISAVVTNVCGTMLPTALIAYFLHNATKRTQILDSAIIIGRSRSRRLSEIMRIIIESGLIITTANLVLFATYLSGSNADYPVSDVLNVVYAIAFNLIIIRSDEDSEPSTRISMSSFHQQLELRSQGKV